MKVARNEQPPASSYYNSSSDSSSESEVEYEPLPEGVEESPLDNPLAPLPIKPITKVNKKKGKKFVSRDSMLSLIESVNQKLDEKITEKTEKDLVYLKRLGQIDEASKNKRAKKDERLNKIKDNLRKGGVRVKGMKKGNGSRDEDDKKDNKRGGFGGGGNGKKSGFSKGGKGGRDEGKPKKKVRFA